MTEELVLGFPLSSEFLDFLGSQQKKSAFIKARILTEEVRVEFQDHKTMGIFQANWVKRKVRKGRELEIFKLLGSYG